MHPLILVNSSVLLFAATGLACPPPEQQDPNATAGTQRARNESATTLAHGLALLGDLANRDTLNAHELTLTARRAGDVLRLTRTLSGADNALLQLSGEVLSLDQPTILSLVLDSADDSIAQVRLGEIVFDDACVRIDDEQLRLVDHAGRALVEVTLSGTVDEICSLACPPEESPRVRIGITMEDISPALARQLRLAEGQAVMIASVTDGGPAARAGLQAYDVVTHINGDAAVTQASLREAVQATSPGSSFTVRVIRQGRVQEVVITPEPYQEPQATQGTLQNAAEMYEQWIVASQAATPPVLGNIPYVGHLLNQQPLNNTLVDAWSVPLNYLSEVTRAPVTVQIQPRIVDGRWIALDTRLIPILTTVDEPDTASAAAAAQQLEFEIGQLEAQVERLRTVLMSLRAAQASDAASPESDTNSGGGELR